jgi:CRP/FNR family transcriptional regulator
MSTNIKDFLATAEPFKRLPANELQRVAGIAQTVTHGKGETIFSEGEAADSVWVLRTGRLEVFKYNSNGNPYAIESIVPGDLYGTLCRLGQEQSSYPCTAVASVDSVSLRIQDKVFNQLFQSYPAVVTGVCLLCSKRLHGMQQLTGATQEPVDKRIVRVLIHLAETEGNILSYTKRQIGEFAATTVETTIRTLGAFERQRLIATARGKITLKNLPRLKALVE